MAICAPNLSAPSASEVSRTMGVEGYFVRRSKYIFRTICSIAATSSPGNARCPVKPITKGKRDGDGIVLLLAMIQKSFYFINISRTTDNKGCTLMQIFRHDL